MTATELHEKLRLRWRDWRYRCAAAAVLKTPPLAAGRLPFTLLSMVHHRDVLRYLVAAKSFLAQAPAVAVVVVCDPTITPHDRQVMRTHLPHLVLRDAAEFVIDGLPRGGCWERLIAISHLAADRYVVQLDADTLTLAAVPEIVQAVGARAGFVLGESAAQTPEPLARVSQTARDWLAVPGQREHIQDRVEADFVDAGLPAGALYVRGCAGFTGFPPDPTMHARLREFSVRMAERHGARWQAWGTEQITSNYLVANAAGTRVLPFPRYTDPREVAGDTTFIHFIGYLRFRDRRYEALTRDLIRQFHAT